MLPLVFRFFGFLFSWLAIGSIMALAGLAAIFMIYGKDLPDHAQLAQYEPPTLSRIYSGQGALMDEFARERRIFTPIDEIPDRIKQAFVSAEDKNFYAHHGFDPRGIAAAIYEAAQGGRLRGASTITQQVMKNFLLTGDRSGERKIKEIILATRLEATLSKDQILELYLNEIFLGQNSYGVTAAAQIYFAKSLEELTLAETAYLAALPQAPAVLHPVREKERAIARRNYVLDQMRENGFITRDEAQAAKAEDLLTVQGGAIASARAEMPPRDYFTDEIRRQLSKSLGDDALFTGGLTIRATVDPELQEVAARALRDGLEEYDRGTRVYRGPVDAHRGAARPRRRGRLAPRARRRRGAARHRGLAPGGGARDRRELGAHRHRGRRGGRGRALPAASRTSSWARLRDDNGRLRAVRGIDDTFDVGDVILVKLLEGEDGTRTLVLPPDPGDPGRLHGDGHPDRAGARDAGRLLLPVERLQPRHPGAAPAGLVVQAVRLRRGARQRLLARRPSWWTRRSRWRPGRASGGRRTPASKFYGPAPIRTGLEQSRNLMTVRIAQDVGMDVVGEYAERFNVYQDMPELISYSLGAGETTLYNMVAAYAMFANGGLRVEPTLVDRVQDRYGETIYRHDRRGCPELRRRGLRRRCRTVLARTPSGSWTRSPPTRSPRCCRARSAAAPGGGRWARWSLTSPARPAPPTRPRTSGSSATPPASRRAASWATTPRCRSATAPSAARSARRSSPSS